MNKITKPSTKSPYKVYLEPDEYGCTLEVKRMGKNFIYEINNSGASSLIVSSESSYAPAVGQKEEVYYLDYLSAATLQKIHLLTENFNHEEVIDGLISLRNKIISNEYNSEDFDMDHSNLFEGYKEILQQLYEFTEESEYSEKLLQVNKFFDNFFYNRISAISTDDRSLMTEQLNKEINYLEMLKSN
jgi:hypothetical protein